ncbi:hypothetical protein MMC16_005893 [Acarospora aff. strigata]|nr:hypothetical protein [Acarospora aff. strigata]
MVAEQLLQEPGGLEFFKELEFLCYTGGPFSPTTGKLLAGVTELCPLYGSTEAFQVPQVVPSPEDWAYMEWNPCFKLKMQPSNDEEGAYELVLYADESTEDMSALKHNLPGIGEWRTKALFKPHPTKPNIWRYYRRRDDIIVLSNGEKFNPVPMELRIQAHPLLAGALVVGFGRAQAALLVEPKSDIGETERSSLAETIWCVVQEANLLVPGHGRIIRSRILVSSPSKPFVRAGKGTIVRKLTEKTYESEIEDLYSEIVVTETLGLPALRPTFDPQAVSQYIRSLVASSFPAAANLDTGDDLFASGFDSLQILQVVQSLKVGLKEHSRSDLSWVSTKTIYEHPTISQLAKVITDFLNLDRVPEQDKHDRIATMEMFVKRFTKDYLKDLQSRTRERLPILLLLLLDRQAFWALISCKLFSRSQ